MSKNSPSIKRKEEELLEARNPQLRSTFFTSFKYHNEYEYS